ncbi:MAG: hypothetical protein FWE21_08130 [Defluviitaleaceae bacterium]|nr:hypothetical protein [Defluviitaleaceae bacterium]
MVKIILTDTVVSCGIGFVPQPQATYRNCVHTRLFIPASVYKKFFANVRNHAGKISFAKTIHLPISFGKFMVKIEEGDYGFETML